MYRPKVCHMTSAHGPFDVRIFLKECKTLANSGYDVVLVAPHPNDETSDGVRIRGVNFKASGRVHRMVRTTWEVYRAARDEKANLYHFHDPELIFVGLLLRLQGKKVVYDAHEDLPKQILTKPWISPVLRKFVSGVARAVETIATMFFSGVVAATPAIARNFPSSKTAVVQNFPILGELVTPDGAPYGSREPLVAYVGGMSVIRGSRELVDAMQNLPAGRQARLLMVGAFESSSLEAELRSKPGWHSVEFLGWRSRVEVKDLLSRVRVGAITFLPAPNHTEAQPNKLFEYMSAGIPVVASDFPLWRDIVERSQCGLLVNPKDDFAIAAAIEWLLSHPDEAESMGRRGYEAVQTDYHWEPEGRKLLRFYQQLI